METVADPEYRNIEGEDTGVDLERIGLIHRIWRAGQNYTLDPVRRTQRERLRRRVAGIDFRIHTSFPYPTAYELGGLATEIQYDYLVQGRVPNIPTSPGSNSELPGLSRHREHGFRRVRPSISARNFDIYETLQSFDSRNIPYLF